ncbi:PP2C family protein-serine/threonine phosphatase [Candidatus Rhodobacter oscarellae]|uniref:PP2C family protein-serine/threonine phosphatase n=1 Tax=Candidatus Rhodobacter oscarellae TaxID=1675527 RepID=UPI00067112BC|nr:fused response regulator/phosphatase [Candidatus Rhodobacter lobularis]
MPPRLDEAQQETILVVDDSRAQRRLVSAQLGRWGYHVVEAASGEEALEICQADCPDFVVSDWMMPGMSGLELCRRYRALRGDRYGYFILLTSKSEKGEVAEGLDVGADDFLTKPFNAAELRSRIRAGQRILEMERELTEKKRLVTTTLEELRVLYDAIDRDLVEARKLQQSLVPDRHCAFSGADVSMLLKPAGHVGGDLVGVFPVSETEIGIYSLDVSGHGIASALITARLAGQLSGSSPKQNAAIKRGADGALVMRSPAAVCETLNKLILDEIETEHYFTILLGRVNLATGEVTLAQAGHPHPVIQRVDGSIEFLGQGGLPIGLVPGAEFTEFEVTLNPGDRLLLGSDGITECESVSGQMLEDEGLERLLRANRNLSGLKFFEALMWDLSSYAGDQDFADDVSAVLLEYRGL